MRNAAVERALEARLTAVSPGAAIASTLIAGENSLFDPSSLPQWYRGTHIPGDSMASEIGSTAQNQTIGIFQVDIFDQKGNGKAWAKGEADRVAECYKRGTVLTDTTTGQTLLINSASPGPGDEEDEYYRVPVKIEWIAYMAN